MKVKEKQQAKIKKKTGSIFTIQTDKGLVTFYHIKLLLINKKKVI